MSQIASRVLLFILLLTVGSARGEEAERAFGENVRPRGSLDNSRIRFEKAKAGRVAFIGGSITEMNGYRPMVSEALKRRFPETAFAFVDAGVASTCSTTGAFRLARDVFGGGPVDLLFVEFAVNDDQDPGHARRECVRGMEGLIRHARAINPEVDVVVTYFVNEGMLKTLQEGNTPLTVEAHEAVAAHYGVPTVHLAKEVAGQVTAGALTWKQYGGVHPAPHGNAIAARMIEELFDRAWAKPLAADAKATAHPLPAEPLDAGNYERGRFIDPKEARIVRGWTLGVPDWKALPGGKRERFASAPMLTATEAGAEATLAFEGTAVGAYVLAGPDAGVLVVSVDGGDFREVDLYHRHSKGLHYPRTVMFATDLKPGRHALTVRVAEKSSSGGRAARVMQFVAN